MNRGLVGNISRYALHDGPGIRTTVFFKGCSLRCPWCHNPELISLDPEIALYREYCIGCGDCAALCPEGAAQCRIQAEIDFSRCTGCGLCARECPARALELVGKYYRAEELMDILLRDRIFYESSGGGVTLSGGEPTAQMPFIGSLLKMLKREGIHTLLETNGSFAWEAFQTNCLADLDLIFFDIKIADPEEHKMLTGGDNRGILTNLARLVALRPKDVVVRIPLIPGYTATERNIGRLADLLQELGVRRYSLLAYHPYGQEKMERIGRTPDAIPAKKGMESSELKQWHQFFRAMEIFAS